MEPFLSLLVFLVVAAIILWLASYVLANIPVDPMPKNLIMAVIALLLLIYLMRMLGVL